MKRLLIAITFFCAAALAAAPPVPEAEWTRLLAGEVVLLDARDTGSGGAAHARALVRAGPEAVWRVITSCEAAFVFVEGLERCDILEDTGTRVRVRQVVDKSWLLPRQDFVFESLRTPFREIRVHLLEGNLDALEAH
jgi:hypothetical protein